MNELTLAVVLPYVLVALLASSIVTMPGLRHRTNGGTFPLLALKTPAVLYFLPVSAQIKRRRALLDAVTVIAAVLMALWLPLHVAVPALLLFAALCAVSHIDLRTKRLPHHLTNIATLSALALAFMVASTITDFLLAAASGFLFALLFFLIGVTRKGSLGFGDVLLAVSGGTLAGIAWGLWGVLLAFIGAGLLGMVPLLGLIVAGRGRIPRKMRIPFGVNIALGSVLALALGVLFASGSLDAGALPDGVLRI